jgi:hypothetical protein
MKGARVADRRTVSAVAKDQVPKAIGSGAAHWGFSLSSPRTKRGLDGLPVAPLVARSGSSFPRHEWREEVSIVTPDGADRMARRRQKGV